MITLETARKLKKAGLLWRADIHDFFAIPERDMDERIFVVTDVMAYLEILRGWPVVTFHGTAEWALDYILTTDVVWMPTEGQLREALEDHLAHEESIQIQLTRQPEGAYICSIQFQGKTHTFTDENASETYAAALLHILEQIPV